jgi:hypothetical protein
MFNPVYSQLLDMNQELHSEFQDEISTNKTNKKKIHSLVKELEQCYQTISFILVAETPLISAKVSVLGFG